MKTTHPRHPLLIITLFILLLGSLEARILRPMDFQYYPGLEGQDAVLNAYPNGNPQDADKTIRVKVFPLEETGYNLLVKDYKSTDTIHLTIPNRGKEELICTKVYSLSGDTSVVWLAEWRKWYTKGRSLMDYKGNAKTRRPADFDAYWTRSKAELAKTPCTPIIEPYSQKDSSTGRCYKITLPSFGNITIFGWYIVPRDVDIFSKDTPAKTYPAVQWAPGYGGGQGPVDWTPDGYITLGLNIRGHGISSTYFKLPTSHHLWNIEDPETYYYRGAYMDIIRGIDFLASRPEVNQKHIAVEGSSQGGAFALAGASLDKRVSCAVAYVPYLGNIQDYGYWCLFARGFADKLKDPVAGPKVARTIGYIDTANLAETITCPMLIIVGAQDRTCPPLCGIVDYNRLPKNTIKKLVIDPIADHENTQLMRDASKAWKLKYLQP